MSRRPRPPQTSAVEWSQADLATGRGMRAALADVDVVVHLASLPYRARSTTRVDVEGTARLVAIAARAGVTHLLYTSIVGVDRIPWPYFQKKLAAEASVRGGPVEWSIVRATQFFSLIDRSLEVMSRLPLVIGPADTLAQPVATEDVAQRLAEQIARGPSRQVEEYGGPEVLHFGELARQWQAAHGRHRRIQLLPIPGRLGRALRSGAALPTQGTDRGNTTWRQWLS